jgi:hypothetical protein
MQDTVKRTALIVLLLVAVTILIFSSHSKNRVKVYDCSLSEISPDYPIEVKEECRKIRYEEWKRQQDEQKISPSRIQRQIQT